MGILEKTKKKIFFGATIRKRNRIGLVETKVPVVFAVVREVGKGVCERSEVADPPKRPENTRKRRNFVCLRVRSVAVRRGDVVRVRGRDRSVGQVSICPTVPSTRNLANGGRNGDGFRTFKATVSTEKK